MTTIFFGSDTCNSMAVLRPQTPTTTGKYRWTWRAADNDIVDEAVVLRLIEGEHISGTRQERLEATRRLHATGISTRAIAERLGVHHRQVDRDIIDLQLRATGANAQRRAVAAQRRRVVAALVNAGARRSEIGVLLQVDGPIVSGDFAALGIPGTGPNRHPTRSHSELLATFGHLLTDQEATG